MRAGRTAAALSSAQGGDEADHQADADQQEHVAVAHHEGLVADDPADRDDGLMLGDRGSAMPWVWK